MVLERRAVSGNDNVGTSAQFPSVAMRAVIFAEPGATVQHHNETGLLPGDKLLEVNGVKVEDRTREDIIDMIKASGESVTLKVTNSIKLVVNISNIMFLCLCRKYEYFSIRKRYKKLEKTKLIIKKLKKVQFTI